MSKEELSWDQPHAVDDIEAAIPARVEGTLLPPMVEIPEEVRNHRF